MLPMRYRPYFTLAMLGKKKRLTLIILYIYISYIRAVYSIYAPTISCDTLRLPPCCGGILRHQSTQRWAVQPGAADLGGTEGEEERQGWEALARARVAGAELGDEDVREHGGPCGLCVYACAVCCVLLYVSMDLWRWPFSIIKGTTVEFQLPLL